MGVERGYRTCSRSSARRSGSQWNLGWSDSKTQIFNHHMTSGKKYPSCFIATPEVQKLPEIRRPPAPKVLPTFCLQPSVSSGRERRHPAHLIIPGQKSTASLLLIIWIWYWFKLFPHYWTCLDPPSSHLASQPGCSRWTWRRGMHQAKKFSGHHCPPHFPPHSRVTCLSNNHKNALSLLVFLCGPKRFGKWVIVD